MRAICINAVCAECGELLDTNEASLAEVKDNDGVISDYELYVGTTHECFSNMEQSEQENGH